MNDSEQNHPQDNVIESLVSWERFLSRAAQTARDMVTSRPVKSPDDEALIVRNCARLMRQALDWEVESEDSRLTRLGPWEVLALTGAPPGPNLDSPYTLARLDPTATYRLSGTTEGLLNINVQVRPGFPPHSYEVYGDLGFDDLDIKHGKWELLMGPTPVGKQPFLQFPQIDGSSDAMHLFLRLYWTDWQHASRPVVELECLDEVNDRHVLTSAALEKQLSAASEYLDMRAEFQHKWFEWFFNTVDTPSKVPGGNAHVNYKGERYRLTDDEALLIEFDSPDAPYWSVQLYDGIVYDCMDFFRNITSRNNLQSHVDPDGRVRIVVSHRDPGIQNWLDAAGVEEASYFYRSFWAKDNPPVSARKVTFDQLPTELHPETKPYTGAQRIEELRTRRRKLAHHFFW